MFAQALQEHLPMVLVEITNEYVVGTDWSWKYDRVMEEIISCSYDTHGYLRSPESETPAGPDFSSTCAVLFWVYGWLSDAPRHVLWASADRANQDGDMDREDALWLAMSAKDTWISEEDEGDASA